MALYMESWVETLERLRSMSTESTLTFSGSTRWFWFTQGLLMCSGTKLFNLD